MFNKTPDDLEIKKKKKKWICIKYVYNVVIKEINLLTHYEQYSRINVDIVFVTQSLYV